MAPSKVAARVVAGLASGALLALAGCSASTVAPPGSSASPSGVTPASASTSAPASASVSASPSASATVLADGRYAARITAVDPARRLVTIDVVQLFMGKAAASAAAQDHAPEVPPPNGVWIRNQSHLLRTFYVTSTAPITVNDLGAVITHNATMNLRVTLTQLGSFPGISGSVFWLTVEHGVVTRLAEQYLP